MDADIIAQVRSFNRTVTHRIGALHDEFLARDRPLGQARVLWEVGTNGSDVRLLRSRLELDSGYLSRILRALENDGLVELERSGADGRVRVARLTDAGAAEVAKLDLRSDRAALALLEPLTEEQRARLATAMGEVERLLIASMVSIGPADPRSPEARSCLRAYFAELSRRFPGGFDPALSIAAADADMTPPAGVLLIAMLHGEPAGCGAVKFHDGKPAEIKRMWVNETLRGLGLGRRILAELEAHATSNGVQVLRLETNRTLAEAIGLYRSAGYHEVPAFNAEPYAHHWFEKTIGRSAALGPE